MRPLFQHLPIGIRGVVGIVAGRVQVPFNLQGPAPFHGRPGIGCNHSDAAKGIEGGRLIRRFNTDDLLNAGHLQGCAVVDALDLRTVHRWPGNDRIEHILQIHVGAKHRLPGDNILAINGLRVGGCQLAIDQTGLLADKAQLVVRLQEQSISPGHIEISRRTGKLSKAKLPARSRVNHLVHLCTHLGDRHAPFIGRRLFQHQPGSRTSPAYRVIPVTHTAGTVGVLVTVLFLISRRLPDPDPVPVCPQFVGGHHRQARANPLTHLGPVIDERYQAI